MVGGGSVQAALACVPPLGQPSPPAPPGLSSCQDHLSAVIRTGKLLGYLLLGHCCGVGVRSSSYGGHAAWLDRGRELGSEGKGSSLTPSTILCQRDHYSSRWRPGLVGPRGAPVLTPCLVAPTSPAVMDGRVGSEGLEGKGRGMD